MTPSEIGEELCREKLREGVKVGAFTHCISGDIFLEVNGLIALPAHPVNKYYADDLVHEIPIIIDKREIGALCLMSKIEYKDDLIASLTDYQYCAYVSMIDSVGFLTGTWSSFSNDCVVVKSQDLSFYLSNCRSSPLWGGYSHIKNSSDIVDGKISSINSSIEIIENCHSRTDRHQECLDLSARAIHSTERFLHLYHYLELDYDYEIVSDIKKLNENDPQGLWEILKIAKDDIERIFYILRKYSDFEKIEKFILKIRDNQDAALRIFYEHGKDSNPIKDSDAFIFQFINSLSINRPELDRIKKAQSLKDNFASNDTDYNIKLIRLVCYWIYRIRCSIAHNKLGEYYLNKSDDMDFLIDFAEPLLIEMVRFRMAS